MENSARPIIIIKKKAGHGGHHGGAWKVAYADFVTAMMALFIVLWLMNTSKPVQEAISGYFKDPAGTAKKVGRDHRDLGKRFRSPSRTWRNSKSNWRRESRALPTSKDCARISR